MATEQKSIFRNLLLTTITLAGITLSLGLPFSNGAMASNGDGSSPSPLPGMPRQLPSPSAPRPTHPSVIERYMFSYQTNPGSPVIYIGTGYTQFATYKVGQVTSVPGLSGSVNALITSVDDTIPYDAQLLNSPITVTQQYQTTNPQYTPRSWHHNLGGFQIR